MWWRSQSNAWHRGSKCPGRNQHHDLDLLLLLTCDPTIIVIILIIIIKMEGLYLYMRIAIIDTTGIFISLAKRKTKTKHLISSRAEISIKQQRHPVANADTDLTWREKKGLAAAFLILWFLRGPLSHADIGHTSHPDSCGCCCFSALDWKCERSGAEGRLLDGLCPCVSALCVIKIHQTSLENLTH